MKKVLSIAVFTILAAFTFSRASVAGQDTVFYHGTVISNTAGSLLIDEYDSATDNHIKTGYSVRQNAVLENLKNVSDLKPGDQVGFLYLEGRTKKTIIRLILYPTDEK